MVSESILEIEPLQMVSNPISDLGVGFVWPHIGVCLFDPQSYNSVDVVYPHKIAVDGVRNSSYKRYKAKLANKTIKLT